MNFHFSRVFGEVDGPCTSRQKGVKDLVGIVMVRKKVLFLPVGMDVLELTRDMSGIEESRNGREQRSSSLPND